MCCRCRTDNNDFDDLLVGTNADNVGDTMPLRASAATTRAPAAAPDAPTDDGDGDSGRCTFASIMGNALHDAE